MAPSKKQTKSVYLIGFSGSGKSTISPKLAKALGVTFYDSDAMIEKQAGMTVSEIFSKVGERKFRKIEQVVIAKIVAARGIKVVSLGGGSLLTPANRKIVLADGLLIYLSCSVREIYRRLMADNSRPLLNGQHESRESRNERIKSLLSRRVIHYQLADLSVSTTNRTIGEVLKKIKQSVKEKYGNN